MNVSLRSQAGLVHSRILGIGTYRPRRVVRNAELCRTIKSTPEWIEERSGIRERRFAAEDETLLTMASAAARASLAATDVAASEVDYLVVASMSNMLQTPPLSVLVCHEIGARRAAGIDVSGACAGFCHAVAIASDAVRTGNATNAIVIGVERMTDIVDPEDRTVSVLFGDGAGAVLIGRSTAVGVGPVVRRADGAHASALRMSGYWGEPDVRPWMQMDGRDVFRWAVKNVVPACSNAVRAAGLALSDIDVFVPHQANLRMIETMTKRLGLRSDATIARDVINAGNTSAASIPLALDALRTESLTRAGDIALLVGFGAGMNYAAQVVIVP
ncbi:beta-ketoacyl-ACP synthase 3 [Actinoplanes awajinensis]|uniref:beta-ketoacyl-ACP synthase 3 n=1 Tax=Actinoplanes awajinensis TaxID=135946 RepID=UPI0009FC8336|nr:beta-ketoacyl-ACP synthase 3 [Actinoplanes awajinensis]